MPSDTGALPPVHQTLALASSGLGSAHASFALPMSAIPHQYRGSPVGENTEAVHAEDVTEQDMGMEVQPQSVTTTHVPQPPRPASTAASLGTANDGATGAGHSAAVPPHGSPRSGRPQGSVRSAHFVQPQNWQGLQVQPQQLSCPYPLQLSTQQPSSGAAQGKDEKSDRKSGGAGWAMADGKTGSRDIVCYNVRIAHKYGDPQEVDITITNTGGCVRASCPGGFMECCLGLLGKMSQTQELELSWCQSFSHPDSAILTQPC
jgi:hypothetical protein